MNKTANLSLSLAIIAVLLLAAPGLAQPGLLIPPVVVDVYPEANSHNAPAGSSVSVTYDQDMDPATVNARTFAVHARHTGWLSEAFRVVNGTITLDPRSDFHAGELVQATATTGLRNLNGQGPLRPTVWTFTVAPTSGDAAFTHHQVFDNPYTRGAALGDLDGDGDLDLVTTNCVDARVYLNDGQGTFTKSQAQDFWSYCLQAAALGDLDGDGDLDAVLLSSLMQLPNWVWVNDGHGTFTVGSRFESYGNTVGALGDLDGDGDLDLFATGGSNRVWRNNGYGTFTLAQTFDADYVHWSVALGDLDGDWDLDAFTTGTDNTYDKVWLNDGNGLFTEAQSISPANTVSVLLGDLDGDGDLDAYRSEANAWVNFPDQIWTNDGRGHFEDTGQRVNSHYSVFPALGDLDADGDLDIYIADYALEGDQVWANNGTGGFSLFRALAASGRRSAGALLGDVDGNGSLDVVVGGPWAGRADVYLNHRITDLLPMPR